MVAIIKSGSSFHWTSSYMGQGKGRSWSMHFRKAGLPITPGVIYSKLTLACRQQKLVSNRQAWQRRKASVKNPIALAVLQQPKHSLPGLINTLK